MADLCRAITWRHQSREGFARLVPAGLFESGSRSWVLAMTARDPADRGNGSTAAGPTLRVPVSREVFDAWH